MQQMLPIYAGLLCNQVGLKFTMGGTTAWSAGGHVNLPALPINDKKTERLACGMIMHEGGHESHTDYQTWETIKEDPVVASMVNRLEDIRIEKKQIERFPGAKTKLQDMVEGLAESGYWRAPKPDDTASTLLGMAILYRLRAAVLSQSALREWGDDALKLLGEAIPQHLALHLTTIAEQVIWCKNTGEVVNLAANILDLLKQEKEKLEEEEQSSTPQQQTQSQQPGQQGQGQGNQGQNAPSQGEDPGQGQGDPQQGQGQAAGQAPGQTGQSDPSNQSGEPASGQGGTQGSQAAGNPTQSAAQAKAIERILTGEEDLAPGDVGKTVCEALTAIGEEGESNIAMPVAKKATLQTGETAEILARVRNASRALQTRAYRLFEASANKKRKYREDGRRVEVSRLWRPKTGDYRVFVEKEEAPRVNTAVQILVDISNSMNHRNRLQPAIDSALALATALSKLNGVKVATATFPAVGAKSNSGDDEWISSIHSFDQRPEVHARHYAAMGSHFFTPTAEALLWAGRELLARKETRKILFVVTDGSPEMPDRNRYAYRDLTVEVRKSLEVEGIEVVGLGIGIDVSGIIPVNVTVNNLDELAGSIFSMMSKTLFEKAA